MPLSRIVMPDCSKAMDAILEIFYSSWVLLQIKNIFSENCKSYFEVYSKTIQRKTEININTIL